MSAPRILTLMLLATAAGALAAPDTADLRPELRKWGLETRRQGQRGTCSVFTVTAALELAAARRTGKGTRFSVEFLNWAGHRAARRRADGGFFSDMWKGFLRFGICPEESLPYRDTFDPDLRPEPSVVEQAAGTRALGLRLRWIKEWNVNTGLTPEQLAEIRRTLAAGWPVCGGFRWPRSPVWKAAVLQMCPPEDVFDGHSVLLVGYRDDAAQPGGGLFLIRNSGEAGPDGALPYAYASQYMNDAAVIDLEAG